MNPENGNNGGGNGTGGTGTGGNGTNNEKFIFYYHPDHLGSSSYISDATGEVTQHLQYFAFGETFLEEHSNTDSTPYLFNGKELDEETGLYYYGARYFDARTSVWSSVDEMAEKYPNVSPYAYCLNNPILFIDPDGRDIELPSGTSRKDTYRILGSLQKLTDDKLVYSTKKNGSISIKIASLGKGNKTAGTNLIRKLNSDDNTVTIGIQSNSNNTTPENQDNAKNGKGTNSSIMIDPDNDVRLRVDDGKGGTKYETASDEIILGHELVHSLDHVEGTLDRTKANHTYEQLDGTTRLERHGKSEYKASGFKGFTRKDGISENALRKEQGLKQRASYETIKNERN